MDKKTFKIVGLIIFLLFTVFIGKAQENSIGIALKGSTMGYGADVVFQFHEKMTARIGYDQLKLGPFDIPFEEASVSYDTQMNFKTGSILALYDYYIAESFFISAGIGINNLNVNMIGQAETGLLFGDIEIPRDKIGDFDITLEPGLKLSPYLGLGVGKTIAKDRLVDFCLEIGSYIMGSPDLTVNSTGLISPTSDPDQGQELILEEQVSQYYLYPVIKLSLSFNIYSF